MNPESSQPIKRPPPSRTRATSVSVIDGRVTSLRVARLVPALAAALWAAAYLAPRPAAAAETAKAYFDGGVRKYNLGHFQDAITDFEKAYNIDPAPILLFNIAQSHRQLGDKDRALFFYRRYLEQAPNAANKGEVEQRMKDLTQSLQQEKDLKQKPPPGVETKDPQPPKPVVPEVVTKIQEPPLPPEEGPQRWLAGRFPGAVLHRILGPGDRLARAPRVSCRRVVRAAFGAVHAARGRGGAGRVPAVHGT